MNKRIICFLLVIISLLIFSSCSSIKIDKEKAKISFEEDFNSFKDLDYVFYKVDFNDCYKAFTRVKGKTIVLLAYNPIYYECPYCLEVMPIINDIAKELGIKEILYYDIYSSRVSNDNNYQKLLEYIKTQVDDLDKVNQKDRLTVPDIYVINNGVILGHHIATLKDDAGSYIKDLNNNQKEELKKIYRNLLGKS